MKTIKVVAAILHKDHQILIAKRNYGEFEGLFEFPGGKIEPGETGEEALKREILEEMEVHINVEGFFMNVHYEYPTFILDMDCYTCTLVDTHMTLNNHSEVKWIHKDDIETEWVPADILVINEIRKRGLDHG